VEASECLLKLLVASDVQRTEVLDERGEAIGRALVDAVPAAVDGGEHLGGKTCGFHAQGGNAFADERIEVGLHAAGGVIGDAAANMS
jgi:hypothetical protein